MDSNNLKRSHDEFISEDHVEFDQQAPTTNKNNMMEQSSTTPIIVISENFEPGRKKLKACNVDEYVEDIKYWYHIVANLEIGSTFKSFDQLEKGLTDPEKVIENLNQLWHVHKARLILESLDLKNPMWSEDWFETSGVGELPTNIEHDMDKELKLKDKVTAADLGLTREISTGILKEYISKREDIESHGLFLVEKLFKRCRVHSVAEITEMMEKCIEIDPQNLYSFFSHIFEDSMQTKVYPIKSLIEKWKKYILPNIVKTQNELNMIDSDPIVLEDNEESKLINKLLLQPTFDSCDDTPDEKQAFLLECTDFSLEEEVPEVKQYEHEEEMENDIDEIVDDVFYYTYLFDLELPDEEGTDRTNFSLLMHQDQNNPKENIFLSILEITMRMYIKDTNPLEHQESEVSEMRLGVSLMILDCLNKELTCLIMSLEREHTHMTYRALVRAILDQFIVDYLHPTDYDKYIFAHCTNPDIQPMMNVMFENDDGDPLLLFNNITWDISQQQRGICDWSESDSDEEGIEAETDKHPFWGDVVNLKEKYLTQETNGQSKVSRKNIDESMYITYYPETENPITEPITKQSMVSFFKLDYDYYSGDPSTYELSADNLIENRSIDCNYRYDKSLHLDLTRLMRRAGVRSNDEGVLIEAYTTLRNYIALCLQRLEERVGDQVVEVDDINKITKMLFSDESTVAIKDHMTLQAPYYYKLDYQDDTSAAKSYEEALEEDLDDTEIVKLVDTNNLVREYPEGLPKDLYNALRDDQIRVLCDSFVKTDDGLNVGIYTPIIKHRLPDLFAQFFSTEEKRNNGLSISTVHFEVQEGEKLVFDERNVTEWLTCIYNGVFEYNEGDGSLTIEKLLAKWPPQTIKSDGKCEEIDLNEEEDTEEEEDESSDEDSDYSVEDVSEDSENEYDQYEENTKKMELSKDDQDNDESTETQNLSQLFLDDESKDFPLIVNTHKIKVHKYILALRSSYFKVLFSGNFSDKNVSEYDVSDFLKNFESLELFCYFLYHDTLENERFSTPVYYTYQNLVDLFAFSQFLLNEKLKQECAENFSKYLDYEGVVDMLRFSFETNEESIFKMAHAFLLKTTYPYFERIIDEATSKYYQVLSTTLTVENALFKLDYLIQAEKEKILHQFLLDDIKIQMENIHWFIAWKASSFDKNLIKTLPQPIQDLTSRFHTQDNLGMASFEIVPVPHN